MLSLIHVELNKQTVATRDTVSPFGDAATGGEFPERFELFFGNRKLGLKAGLAVSTFDRQQSPGRLASQPDFQLFIFKGQVALNDGGARSLVEACREVSDQKLALNFVRHIVISLAL